jgi:serine/threonine-protein kinase
VLALENRSGFHYPVVTGEASRLTDAFRLTGTVFEGRFEIEREIAEGGFAVVYRARHLALDRPVALKVLKTPRGPGESSRDDFQQRFAAEAKTIARLKHPNIVDVYDFAIGAMPNGESAPWMVLEWLDGETLATRLLRRRQANLGGLCASDALSLFRPVIQALAFAHQQGIVHRDIKPANIMVVGGDPRPSLQVLDFGIAKMVDADRPAGSGDTRTDSVPAFTPGYAAPEQVAYSRTGAWTDVHALGLILTELLTNAPPYADSNAHLFEQVMAAERPTPKSKGVDAGVFEPIIAKAVALSPRERWADAGELLAALDVAAGLAETTVRMAPTAAPVSSSVVPSAPARPSRRRRIAVMALAAAAAVAVLGVFSRKGHAPVAPPEPAPAMLVPRAVPPEASHAREPAPVPATPAVEQAAAEPAPHRVAHAKRAAPRATVPDRSVSQPKEVRAKDLFDDTK